MRKAVPLYAGEDLGLEIENTVYAHDLTTADLSLTLFPWADFRKTMAGIKLHTQFDLRGPIPTCIFITGAWQNDVLWLDELIFKPGAFNVMDSATWILHGSTGLPVPGRSWLHGPKTTCSSPDEFPNPWSILLAFAAIKSADPSWQKLGWTSRHSCDKSDTSTKQPSTTWFFHLQPQHPRADCGQCLSIGLANRIVFPLDQGPPSNQTLLWDKP
jgi:hypothetical protein